MKYLKQIGLSWYVHIVIPARLRAAMGKREFNVPLKTRDATAAKRLSHAVIAKCMEQLHAAEAHRELLPRDAEYIIASARATRAAIVAGIVTHEAGEIAMDEGIERHLDALRDRHGSDAEGYPQAGDSHVRGAIEVANKILAGETVSLLSSQIEAHLSEIAKTVRAQTLADKRKVLEDFRAWLAADVDVSTITRKIAGRYLTERLLKTGVASKTITTRLSHVSSFWNWLLARGVVEVNPWLRMASSLPKDKRGSEAPRRAWTDAELVTLLQGTPTNDPLWALAALGMFTGARIEELCALKVADVTEDTLRIREGKSASAVRTLPVHPIIVPLVRRLVITSHDGYLVPGLLTGGKDQRRSAGAVKRFGYHLRHHVGITDTSLTFHSLRHTFTTRLEAAGVPETTAKLLTGHSRGDSLTYGHYSKGLPLSELAKAIERLTYGAADALVKRTAGKVRITFRSHRRPKHAKPVKQAA